MAYSSWLWHILVDNDSMNFLKFGDGDGPNLCRVKKYMLVPHLLKIYFGLGLPSLVLLSGRLKTGS